MLDLGTGAAAQNLAFAGHIIVAADSFDDNALFFDLH